MSSPLDQFKIEPWIPFHIGPFDLSITNSSFYMLVAAFLCVLIPAILLRTKARVLIEEVFEFIRRMTEQYVGDTKYFPIILSLFMFLAISNLIGVIPGVFTTTSHISVTFSLASMMYIFVIGCGLYYQGWHFFQIFFPKGTPIYLAPILIPIEVISFLTKPISLAIRLFANMLAGHILVKIFAGFVIFLNFSVISIIPIGVNAMLIGFEVIVALIQSYVFTLLTCLYLHDVLHLH